MNDEKAETVTRAELYRKQKRALIASVICTIISIAAFIATVIW